MEILGWARSAGIGVDQVVKVEVGALSKDVSSPGWQIYPGRWITVHALDGSYASRSAATTLHDAERAVELLGKLTGLQKRQSPPDINLQIYLLDPPGDGAPKAKAPPGSAAIVRILQPDAPVQPIARAIIVPLFRAWFGASATGARVLIDGLAGVATAKMGGPKVREAHDWVRAEVVAGRAVTILGPGQVENEQAGIDRVATSFTGYLLDAYGPGALYTFLSNYDIERRDSASMLAFERPLGTLEEQWLTHLQRVEGERGNFRALLHMVLPLFKPYWKQQIELLVYMLLGLGYSLAMPLASKHLIDTIIPGGSVDALVVFVLFLFGIYFLNLLVGMRQAWMSAWVNSHILMELQERMFAHLQRLSHDYYGHARIGDIMTRLYSDLQIVQGAMTSVVNSGFYMILSALGASVALLLLSPLLALLVFLVVPLFAFSYFALRSRLRKAGYERQRLSGELSSILQENLSAHAVVKAFGLETRAEEAFHSRLVSFFKSTMRLVLLGSLFETSTGLAVTLGQLLVLGVGGYLVMQGGLTIGTLLAFFGFLPSIFSPVGALAGLGQTVQTASGSLERVNDLLDEPVTVSEMPGATELPPLSHAIRFERVNFSYTGDRLALRDLSLTIPAGAHVAIVGPSGSGKSTVVNLLMRYWDPDSGRVLFDGRDLTKVTLSSLRGQIGLVFQDTFIFDTTLRENIGLGKPGASDAEIAAAASAARLESYIEGLPAGYDTVLGERGVRMSGGQRQRLAIARALLRDPRVLILDEATSALDAATERDILDTLAAVASGRTTISITHRMAFAAQADLIFVLDNGCLVEEGTHADLLRHDGLYASLYREQIGKRDGSPPHKGMDASRLHAIPLFSNLNDMTLGDLATALNRERYAGGVDIVRQGEPGEKLYLIDRGQVDVIVTSSRGEEQRINRLNEGDYFGEMALLAGEPRSATVRTSMPSELYSISRADFSHLLESDPQINQAISETVQGRRVALSSLNESE